ncbi:hypothetical protein [Pedobacter sp. NJ-S-72]
MAIIVVTASCVNNNDKSGSGKTSLSSANPFNDTSKLAYQTPAFDQIKDDDFQPALEEGMKLQLEEMQKIADNTEAPTFENTLVAMEKSGQLLTRTNNVFDALTGANTNPKLQKLQEDIAPKLAAHHDAIYLNSKLFKRIQTVYTNREQLKLDPESKRLVEYYEQQQFELAGAKLSDNEKDKLKKLNEEEASLSAKFSNQLMAANKAGALIVSDKAELAGLSQGELAAAAQNAKANNQEGKWLIPLQNTTQQPSLQSLTNRTTREKLFKASWNRTEKQDANDTRSTIVRIAKKSVQTKLN